MDAQKIKKEINRLKTEGATTYENCEMLVCLERALKYMEEDVPCEASPDPEDAHAMTMQMDNAQKISGNEDRFACTQRSNARGFSQCCSQIVKARPPSDEGRTLRQTVGCIINKTKRNK